MTNSTYTTSLESSVLGFVERNTDILNKIKDDFDTIIVLDSTDDIVTVKYYDIEREISKFAWETVSNKIDSMIEDIENKMEDLNSVTDRMEFVKDVCTIEHVSNELSIMARSFIQRLTSFLAKDR